MKNESDNDTSLRSTTLRSNEFTCPSCFDKIESRLKRVEGVDSVEVKFASGRVIVSHDPAKAPVRSLVDAIAEVGFTAKPSSI